MSSSKKILFITGGNTGLGLETVKALYASPVGYEIIIGSRSVSQGEAAAAKVKAEFPSISTSSLSVVQIDVTSDSSIERAVASIDAAHHRLDILVNNAGASFDPQVQDGKMGVREAFNAAWDVNVAGAHVLTTWAVPLLLRSDDPRLLFVTSGTSPLTETEMLNHPGRVNDAPPKGWPKPPQDNPITGYRCSKAGLNMLMRDWCRVLRKDGVKIWSVSPGYLATGLGGVPAETQKQRGARDPAQGGKFMKEVVEGEQDENHGKAIRSIGIQPW